MRTSCECSGDTRKSNDKISFMSIKEATIKRLFAKSHGVCAMPRCTGEPVIGDRSSSSLARAPNSESFASSEHSPAARRGEQALGRLSGQRNRRGHVKARKKRQRAAALHVASERRARESWFVALLVRPRCLTHL